MHMLPNDFRARYGPAAVVTGASDGIGRECARHLAAAGLELVLVARRAAVLEGLAGELSSWHRVGVTVVAADLSRPRGLQEVMEAAGKRDVGLLVAAAGFGTSGTFVDSSVEREQEMLAVNCGAAMALAHHFGGRFAQRGRGGIVLMSSLLAFQGVPRAAHYAATKAYIQVLAEGLARELRPRGVDVLAAAPGPVASGFAKRADMSMSMAAAPQDVAVGMLSALGRRGTVRPGWLSKALELSLAPLPRAGRVRILERVMAGMTAHQSTAVCHDPQPNGHHPNEAPRERRASRPHSS